MNELPLYRKVGHSLFDGYIANEIKSALRELMESCSDCHVRAVYVNVTDHWFNILVSLADYGFDYSSGARVVERNKELLIDTIAKIVAPKISISINDVKKSARMMSSWDGVSLTLVFHIAILPDPFVVFARSVEGKRLKNVTLLEKYALDGFLSPVRLFLHNEYRECMIDVEKGDFKAEKHFGRFMTLLFKRPLPPEEQSIEQLISRQSNFHSLTLEFDDGCTITKCYLPKIGIPIDIMNYDVPVWCLSDKPEVTSKGLAYNPNRFSGFTDGVSERHPTKEEVDGYYDVMRKLLLG